MDFILFITIFSLLIAFYGLVKSADLLILTARYFGKKLKINQFLIGLTIVAIGTSLPELFTCISSIYNSSNSSSFVIGTILGSNISNILLIFSALLFFSKKFKTKISKIDIFVFLLSSFFLIILIFLKKFSIIQAIIFGLIYILYIYYLIKNKKQDNLNQINDDEDENFIKELNNYNFFFILILFFLSLIGLNFCSKGVVFTIEIIGNILKIPISYLTLTTIALATSLPEMVVTYNCAKSKKYDLGLGNIIGSNISNVFFIGSFIGFIKQIEFKNTEFISSMIFLILATTIFLILINIKKQKKIYPIITFLIYLIYIISNFI